MRVAVAIALWQNGNRVNSPILHTLASGADGRLCGDLLDRRPGRARQRMGSSRVDRDWVAGDPGGRLWPAFRSGVGVFAGHLVTWPQTGPLGPVALQIRIHRRRTGGIPQGGSGYTGSGGSIAVCVGEIVDRLRLVGRNIRQLEQLHVQQGSGLPHDRAARSSSARRVDSNRKSPASGRGGGSGRVLLLSWVVGSSPS